MTTSFTAAFANVNFGLILSYMLQAIGDVILDFFRRLCGIEWVKQFMILVQSQRSKSRTKNQLKVNWKVVMFLCRCEAKMQEQSKSSPDCESSSESSKKTLCPNKTLCASAPHCAPHVSPTVIKNEKDVSRSPSVTDKTLTP